MPLANHFAAAVAPGHLLALGTSATNTAVTATSSALANHKRLVTGVDASTYGTISNTTVTLTLTRTISGVSRTMTWGIPAAQVMPFGVQFAAPGLDTDENTDVTATLSALGVGIIGYVNLYGKSIPVR